MQVNFEKKNTAPELSFLIAKWAEKLQKSSKNIDKLANTNYNNGLVSDR